MSRHSTIGLALLAIAMLLAPLAPAEAFMHHIDANDSVALDDDEGLLVVAVDASSPLQILRVRRQGALLDFANLRRIPIGQTIELYRVKAGEYRWDAVEVAPFGLKYDLEDDPEFHFTVRPGVVNYAGDLLVRPVGLFNAYFHVANRGLIALDWLETERAAAAKLPFAYSGHYPDPFAEFYRRERGSAPLPKRSSVPPPRAPQLPIPIADLWQESRLSSVSLSPDGVLLAQARVDEGKWQVELFDLSTGTATRVIDDSRAVLDMEWSGPRMLVVSAGRDATLHWVSVVHVSGDVGHFGFRTLQMPRLGHVVALLPHDPGHLLFGTNGARDELIVQRVDVSSAAALRKYRVSSRDRLNRGVDGDLVWFADGTGTLRAALTAKDDAAVLHFGRDGKFEPVLTISRDSDFRPLAITPDAREIWGFSDAGRDQREVVVFDPVAKKIVRTAFSKPGIDAQKLLYDARGMPIGVLFFQDGRLVSEFFGEGEQRLNATLERRFQRASVMVVDRDEVERNFVLGVEASDQPFALYHYDATTDQAKLLEQTVPALAGRRLAQAQVVRAKGSDGVAIESYLTLPPGVEQPPLVVLSHGGPIGVRDSLRFDPEVQFIASLGYAVLQVNFRGSEGYGRQFRESGRGKFGTLIEDDVHASLLAALERFPLDGERICAVGTSYGGYSSLVAAVRWPALVDCVVSIAGVTDQVLFFTASDGGRSDEGRRELERAIGDPRRDIDEMLRNSPLYRYRDLHAPVMLVHGMQDIRVDPEHTRRLARLLMLAGQPPVVLSFEDEGHGIEAMANRERAWGAIAGFLRQHLGTPAAAGAKPAVGG